jgi:hypothetical protein
MSEEAKVQELTIRLLETLTAMASWIENFCKRTGIEVPNRDALHFLLGDAKKLITEVTLCGQPSDAGYQHPKPRSSDDKETEPLILLS